MAYQWATWLADALRGAGCTVVEEPGWETRGRPGGSFTPSGVMLHHDASPAGETSNGVDVIRDGRPGLEGPLAQLWLDYSGTWYVVAGGRANHAGEGQWGSIPRDDGNTFTIGIETDHTTDEQWTAGQRSAALAGVAAICDHLGIRTENGLREWFTAHKEYAAGRKIDPDPLDMDYARQQLLAYSGEDPVQKIQRSTQQPRTLVSQDPDGDPWRDLMFSDEGEYQMGRGPFGWYVLTMQVYAEGPPGTVFWLRPYKDSGGDRSFYHQRDYQVGSNGKAFVELSQSGNLAADTYLRVQGKSGGANITLTSTRGQLAGW